MGESGKGCTWLIVKSSNIETLVVGEESVALDLHSWKRGRGELEKTSSNSQGGRNEGSESFHLEQKQRIFVLFQAGEPRQTRMNGECEGRRFQKRFEKQPGPERVRDVWLRAWKLVLK